MNVEYANPFIKGALVAFKHELNVDLQRDKIQVRDSPVPTRNISIIIGLTGAVKGQVVYSMDNNVAEAISKSMLPDKNPAEQKKLMKSAVSELANIITGQASIILAGNDYKIDITPPAVFTGKPGSIDFLAIPTISVTFLSVIGSLEIDIAITGE